MQCTAAAPPQTTGPCRRFHADAAEPLPLAVLEHAAAAAARRQDWVNALASCSFDGWLRAGKSFFVGDREAHVGSNTSGSAPVAHLRARKHSQGGGGLRAPGRPCRSQLPYIAIPQGRPSVRTCLSGALRGPPPLYSLQCNQRRPPRYSPPPPLHTSAPKKTPRPSRSS